MEVAVVSDGGDGDGDCGSGLAIAVVAVAVAVVAVVAVAVVAVVAVAVVALTYSCSAMVENHQKELGYNTAIFVLLHCRKPVGHNHCKHYQLLYQQPLLLKQNRNSHTN